MLSGLLVALDCDGGPLSTTLLVAVHVKYSIPVTKRRKIGSWACSRLLTYLICQLHTSRSFSVLGWVELPCATFSALGCNWTKRWTTSASASPCLISVPKTQPANPVLRLHTHWYGIIPEADKDIDRMWSARVVWLGIQSR